MRKIFLTLTLILVALAATAFLPGPASTVQATGVSETVPEERIDAAPVTTAQANAGAFSASLAMQIVVGAVAVLFAVLTFLPQLEQEAKEMHVGEIRSPGN